MKYFLHLLLCCIPMSLFAQGSSEELYVREWKEIDSLLRHGFPESASQKAFKIYAAASGKGMRVQAMKAQLYMMGARFQRSETAFREVVLQADSLAENAPFPENAIWSSIAASYYWEYYQQNRWKMLDRSPVSGDAVPDDFTLWDASLFFQAVRSRFEASVREADALRKIDIRAFAPIVQKGKNTGMLRPTLLDLLAFRALDFYANEEKDIVRPAFAFHIGEEAAFAPAAVFLSYPFTTQDTGSLQWKGLKLYQQLLLLHSGDKDPAAFIDADLHRLAFAYQYSVHPEKKKLYTAALADVEKRYRSNPLSALAAARTVQLEMEVSPRFLGRLPVSSSNGSADHRVLRKKLEQIIALYPESEGGTLAQVLLQEVLSRDLSLTAEEVVIPGQAGKALLAYRNISKVWVRVLSLQGHDRREVPSDERLRHWIAAQKPVQQDVLVLPAAEDHRQHSTELMFGSLPPGYYLLAVSADESFSGNENILTTVSFQVSRLSMIAGNDGSAFVLDRETGLPVGDVDVHFYNKDYSQRKASGIFRKTGSARTKEDGKFLLPPKDARFSDVLLFTGEDTVALDGFYHYPYAVSSKDRDHTFFFTDRSVYRPGQTIHYKGILVRQQKKGSKSHALINEKTTVTFYDANGQIVAQKPHTTNAYGSFSGSFIAPETGLKGRMRIASPTGAVDVHVEAYKRPQFYAQFDTLEESYSLKDSLSLRGVARAYAGHPVNGASVRYRVVRRTYFPYRWYAYSFGFPQKEEMEIANGTTLTAADGGFVIPVILLPDISVPEVSLPVFSYAVYADVTDVNGETQSAGTDIRAGYEPVLLSLDAPERIEMQQTDTIRIHTTNLNGRFIQTDAEITVYRLKAAQANLRKRRWNMPDQFIIDSMTHFRFFPDDVYRNEDDPLTWPVEKQVLKTAWISQKDGGFPLPEDLWDINGWYRIDVTIQGASGKAITEKKIVQVSGVQGSMLRTDPLKVWADQPSAEPGSVVQIQMESSFPALYVLSRSFYMNEATDGSSVMLQGEVRHREQIIQEADRGGVKHSFLAVKNNRVYTADVFIAVPWTNKQLDLSWETHRNKLLPGENEVWTLTVRGSRKEAVAAEMAATLYDASLDAVRRHHWSVPGLYATLYAPPAWHKEVGFRQRYGQILSYFNPAPVKSYEKQYPELLFFSPEGMYHKRYAMSAALGTRSAAPESMRDEMAAPENLNKEAADVVALQESSVKEAEDPAMSSAEEGILIRKNLRETAFFFPELKTDEEGNIRIRFTMPDVLTQWKLMAFAHTPDMRFGLVEGLVRTQKDLMVQPALPRFLRQGDELMLISKITNLSDRELDGKAILRIAHALTGAGLENAFRMEDTVKHFRVAAGQSTTVQWKVFVPESLYEPVAVQVVASAGKFTDGEEQILPVHTNRMLVTETVPLWMNGAGKKEFKLENLLETDRSSSLQPHQLSVTYTTNPSWYAVMSLPYLMEHPPAGAEQVFNRYYANALAADITKKVPEIKAVFHQWETEGASSFASPLEQNEDLRSALLKETPWVRDAQEETGQRSRIAKLFNAGRLEKELEESLLQLKKMQLQDGGFSWFPGMRSDRFITQYIVSGMGRLHALQISGNRTASLVEPALQYMDRQLEEAYQHARKQAPAEDYLGYGEIQYLYARSFYQQEIPSSAEEAHAYFTKLAQEKWHRFNPYIKGMIGVALYRNGDTHTPRLIFQSLKETAISREEMGMYWQQAPGYRWYEAPVEGQALLIEFFKMMDADRKIIDAMKRWLLKHKQTNHWNTSRATADACYALLLSGSDWLSGSPSVHIALGNKDILSRRPQAGSGYFRSDIAGKDVTPEMGRVSVEIVPSGSKEPGPSWGGVYWQYFENMDRVSSQAGFFQITKELYKEQPSDRGPQLEAVTRQGKQLIPLQRGDKVIIRITLVADRDMEYVHLKDMRAACFEPVRQVSGYRWQDGSGYYESPGDMGTDFFFDKLRKGTYVFEYPVFVSQEGIFSNGITVVQSMYAPEFSGHSSGITVQAGSR